MIYKAVKTCWAFISATPRAPVSGSGCSPTSKTEGRAAGAVRDILITSIDNLTGFGDAIESIFPKADVQLCLVHQVRNSLRYVTAKDQKEVVAALKPIYQATTLALAEQKLTDFVAAWGQKYPLVVESWQRNWSRLTRFFEYPAAIRRVVYTTNTVEGFHRQIRCVTKSKAGRPVPGVLLGNGSTESALPDHATDHGKMEGAVG